MSYRMSDQAEEMSNWHPSTIGWVAVVILNQKRALMVRQAEQWSIPWSGNTDQSRLGYF